MIVADDAALVAQTAGCQAELDALHERIGPRFKRPEVRARAGRYLAGLLGQVEQRNGWQLAEQIGAGAPDGVQRLVRTARWDADAVRDDLRADLGEHLGGDTAVLVVDKTSFLRKGRQSAGVAGQDSGTAGRIEHCQVGVFLAYASGKGRAFLDRELYLPQSRIDDAERRQVAGVPEEATFHAKPGLARALAAGIPAAWVTGGVGDGRRGLRQRRRLLLLAGRGGTRVCPCGSARTGSGMRASCSGASRRSAPTCPPRRGTGSRSARGAEARACMTGPAGGCRT